MDMGKYLNDVLKVVNGDLGELVEIGGKFRIPEVMEQSGGRLVEVGTTNRTYLEDYTAAVTEDTAAFLKVHTSNYQITGFTCAPSVKELAEEAHKRMLYLLVDLGSGDLGYISGTDPEKTVMSVVIHTCDTLESEMFRFWRDGLRVFEQSLSGLEIIMNEINESIIKAVTSDFRYGISSAIEEVVAASQKMEKDVREEQLFDTADFLYGNLNQQLNVTLEKYHANENSLFARSMMGWASLAGFMGEPTKQGTVRFSEKSFSMGSAVKSLFIPPKWENYVSKRSTAFSRKVQDMYDTRKGKARQLGGLRVLEGTFDREMAIKNDYLHFFAPGDEVFDSIVNNALHSDKGQCAAFMVNADFEWKGFVFTLSLDPNTQMLLENDIPITAIGRFKSYISVDQMIVPISFKAYSDIAQDKVIAQLDKIRGLPVSAQRAALIHLGRRKPTSDSLHIKDRYGVSNLEWFMGKYPEETWEQLVNTAQKRAVEYAKSRFGKSSSLKRAEREVDRMMNTELSRSRYFGTAPEELGKIRDRYMKIIQALRKSQIVTESAAFVWMVKADDR